MATQSFLPGKSHGQCNPMGYSPGDGKGLDKAEWLSMCTGARAHTHTHTHTHTQMPQ